jgi:hypothetical protein
MYIYGGRRQGSKLPSAAHQLAVSAGDKHAVPSVLTSLRLPVSYTGLSPDKITPMPGVHNGVHRSRDPVLESGWRHRRGPVTPDVLC